MSSISFAPESISFEPMSGSVRGGESRFFSASASPTMGAESEADLRPAVYDRKGKIAQPETASATDPETGKTVEELRQTDQTVKQHEAAHLAAAGPYVTEGPTYDYVRGPDGKTYAVGGEVGIDTAPESSAEETRQKAAVVARAALAPANPSPQDHAVAAEAVRLAAVAREQEVGEQSEAANVVPSAAQLGAYRTQQVQREDEFNQLQQAMADVWHSQSAGYAAAAAVYA